LLLALMTPGLAGAAPARPRSVVVVTAPSGAAADVVAEGQDFFTHVLRDPRDMDEPLDLRWHVRVRNIRVTGSVWQGEFGAAGQVYAYFPGLDAGAANIGPIGAQVPIDADAYRVLSFRALADRAVRYRWWGHRGLLAEGDELVAEGVLPAGRWETAVKVLAPSWMGTRRGLRLEVVEAADVRLDWVRLTVPDTSPRFAVTWTGPGSGTLDIALDDDQRVGNGLTARLAEDVPDTGRFVVSTAAFPPGPYYVYVEHASDAPGGGAYSPGPLTIVAAPRLAFTAPSTASGADYATTELGDPWDMDGGGDLFINGVWPQSWFDLGSGPLYRAGQLHATTSGVDPYLYLNISEDRRPIETAIYKHLAWRWFVEGTWADSGDRLAPANAWVSRFHYFPRFPYQAAEMNTLNDVVIWEGWNTYELDLSQGYLDDRRPGPASLGWRGTKAGLRFDPLEGSRPFTLHLDWVRLTADPTVRAGSRYAITWSMPAGDRPRTITLHTDRDRDFGNGFAGTIATLAPPPAVPPTLRGPHRTFLPRVDAWRPPDGGPSRYVWAVPPDLRGPVYLCAVVSDGVNVMRWYSDVPLVINP
jgi:hypothetical protein